jgi:hypothetical protein
MSASIPSYLVQILYIVLAWILHPLHFGAANATCIKLSNTQKKEF